jgi:anhydro-N-acetylmuramic acid kinase
MSEPEYFLGLISGTSMDGVDAVLACARQDGGFSLLAHHGQPYPLALVQRLRAAASGQADHLAAVATLDNDVARLFARCAMDLLRQQGFSARQVRAIGSHGQTLRHAPHGVDAYTVQIGNPSLLAELTGITTVADFRRRDLAAGGQAAPLVPAFHAAVFHSALEDRAVLNLGGIANLSLLPANAWKDVIGFDTGPANTLLDAWARQHLGTAHDAGGAWAAGGRVLPGLLQQLLEEAYFALPPPKSTGPELFHSGWLGARLEGTETAQDVMATLAELTAVSVARALRTSMPDARRLLVCGGGVHNLDLMRRLQAQLSGVLVEATTAHGIEPQWVEAGAFAWLAMRTLRGLPGNLPAVTGAAGPRVLGGIYPA